MTPEEHKASLRRFTEDVINGRDWTAFDELVAPGCLDRSPFPGVSPDRNGLRASIEMLHAAFPDLRSELGGIIAEGDRAVYRGTLRGTHKSAFLGAEPSGKAFEIDETHIVRFAEGRWIEHWVEIDLLGLLKQIGAVPHQGG
jgi:predicted ester cyclase